MSANPVWPSAEELLAVLPSMNSLIAIKLRQEIDADITLVQFMVLEQLQEHPITLTALAEQRGVTRQAASLQVQGVVERGWVRRLPDPTDRRQQMLEVTEEGRTRLREAREALTTYAATLLEMLTPEEFAAMQIVLPAFRRLIAKATELRSAIPAQE